MARGGKRGWQFALVLLALAVMGSAISVVYSKHLNRSLFVDLRTLQTARDDMNVEWVQLQLELASSDAHSEVERLARERLGMALPAPTEVEIVRP